MIKWNETNVANQAKTSQKKNENKRRKYDKNTKESYMFWNFCVMVEYYAILGTAAAFAAAR